jgi:cytochrome c oxidase cbb3-type subunit 4
MDYGTFRGIFTLVLMVLFIVIVWCAFIKRTKSKFDEADNAIFEDEKKHETTINDKEKESEK